MLAGAVPFKIFFLIYHGKVRDMLRDNTVRLLLLIALAGSLITSVNLFLFGGLPIETAFREGVFTSVAAICTCGLQNSNPHFWAAIPIIIVTMLMFIGGAMGSTAGGIKINRVALAYEGVKWWFRRFFVSSRVLIPLRYGGKTIAREISDLAISKNMLVIIIYFLTIFIATIVTLHLYITSFPLDNVVFELVSALSNSGISVGLISASSPFAIKWIFIVLMWLGRLEIVPVVIIIMGIIKGIEEDVASGQGPVPLSEFEQRY